MTSHIFALVEAVHGAHSDAVHGFAANALDDVSQFGTHTPRKKLLACSVARIDNSAQWPDLLTNSNTRISPHASVSTPYRLSARPIAVPRRCWYTGGHY